MKMITLFRFLIYDDLLVILASFRILSSQGF